MQRSSLLAAASVGVCLVMAFASPAAAQPAALTLTTPAFQPGGPLSWRYTCYNANEPSPPLAWSGMPDGTVSLGIVMDAPDRPDGIFTQWVIFNLPASLTELPEGVPRLPTLDNGAIQGRNDFGRLGFSAPCPPVLTTATYRLALFALDTTLDLPPGASEDDVLAASNGHVLARVQVTTTYLRPAWPWG